MNLKITVFIFVFFLTGLPIAQAYPWVGFQNNNKESYFKLDTQLSYFPKGQWMILSGIDLDYHHPTIDIDLAYTYSFFENKAYFRISELAFKFPFVSEKWKMTLGFRDVLWSQADRYWNYGLWQARYMLDAFRPIQMGLPGLYLDYKGKTSFRFLISYLYLPDIIAYPQFARKKITSENPFFINRMDRFDWDIGNKFEPFQVKRFLKPTIAFQVEHLLKSSKLSLSYAYKPINQFQYSVFFKKFNLSSGERNQFTVDGFQYSILSHHLVSLEGESVLDENVSLLASLLYEKPENRIYEKDWISDKFESHLTFSLLASFYEDLGKASKALLTLAYTKTMENHLQRQISNIVTEDFEEVFGRSFYWKEALGASLEYQNKDWLHGFLFRFRTNYALDNGFYSLALEQVFYLSSHLQMYLSGDMIFRLSDHLFREGTSSIKKHKDLSRLLVGGKYVF